MATIICIVAMDAWDVMYLGRWPCSLPPSSFIRASLVQVLCDRGYARHLRRTKDKNDIGDCRVRTYGIPVYIGHVDREGPFRPVTAVSGRAVAAGTV